MAIEWTKFSCRASDCLVYVDSFSLPHGLHPVSVNDKDISGYFGTDDLLLHIMTSAMRTILQYNNQIQQQRIRPCHHVGSDHHIGFLHVKTCTDRCNVFVCAL